MQTRVARRTSRANRSHLYSCTHDNITPHYHSSTVYQLAVAYDNYMLLDVREEAGGRRWRRGEHRRRVIRERAGEAGSTEPEHARERMESERRERTEEAETSREASRAGREQVARASAANERS